MEEERTDSEAAANAVTEVQTVTEGGKPLHRFLAGEPKYIGIALIFFGSNEMMLGLGLIKEIMATSASVYIPFWQGALFTLCGSLSIHTHSYPSKKLVTVCLAMYIVTVLGGIYSLAYRLSCFSSADEILYADFDYWSHYNTTYRVPESAIIRYNQLVITEAVLFTATICVIVLLICLCCFARRSLKSSNTQIIMRQVLTITDTERE